MSTIQTDVPLVTFIITNILFVQMQAIPSIVCSVLSGILSCELSWQAYILGNKCETLEY